jgi:hypothetical protein
MALGFAADLRDGLPEVQVSTLLGRAPLNVGQALHPAIANSELVVLRRVGQSSVQVADRFNLEIRQFLRRLNHNLAQR